MSITSELDQEFNEAKASLERAIAGINTIHLGPLDYNIVTTVDDCLVAIRILERIARAVAEDK